MELLEVPEHRQKLSIGRRRRGRNLLISSRRWNSRRLCRVRLRRGRRRQKRWSRRWSARACDTRKTALLLPTVTLNVAQYATVVTSHIPLRPRRGPSRIRGSRQGASRRERRRGEPGGSKSCAPLGRKLEDASPQHEQRQRPQAMCRQMEHGAAVPWSARTQGEGA